MRKHHPILSSVQNPRIKQAVKLRDRKERDHTDLFLIEGYREILRCVEAGKKIETLFVCPKLFLGINEEELIDQVIGKGAQVFECLENVFRKISYRDRPDGLLAIAPQIHLALDDIPLPSDEPALLVVAEAIEKPGNLGTILRSCDAVGVHALLVCDRCTDIHNPNVVRASVGTLFTVPVIESEGEAALQWLKDKGIAILAATPRAEMEYTEADMTVPAAIVVGTEQFGLSDMWMKNADIQVKIPMRGAADSLNVATATTLLMYEALRQRKKQHD